MAKRLVEAAGTAGSTNAGSGPVPRNFEAAVAAM